MGTVTKGEKKPLKNKYCYPELYAKWLASGSGKQPKCRVCGETIQWEEHHFCLGYKPTYNETDSELRNTMHDQLREASLEEMRESRRTHECSDCGEELHDEEHAIAHPEDCPAREEWDGDYERDSV